MTDYDTTVLVVGAGPAGLTLAASLLRYGVSVRIIDKAAVPPDDRSRATVIQPRTLEVFDDLGIVDEALSTGLPVRRLNVYGRSGHSGSASFGTRFLDSPYANLLTLPQDQTERILGELVQQCGGRVERGVELAGYSETADSVQAELKHADGRTESTTVRWIAGCDGAHSTVRQNANLDFTGITYPDEGLLGDVFIDWNIPEGQVSLCPQRDGFLLVFPLRGERHFRIIMILPRNERGEERHLELDEFRHQLERMTPTGMGAKGGPPVIERALWLTRYRLHRRGVKTYRSGRAFLAGDAAHIHSPVGGQGMNTGIQDAYNLAWKLALVENGDSPIALLDTYSFERHKVGETLLRGTDRMFAAVAGGGAISTIMRTFAPVFAARLFSVAWINRKLARFVSQLGIRYRDSPLSDEGPGAKKLGRGIPRAGDRAPDAPILDYDSGAERLFDLFRGPHYTMLVFGGDAATDRAWRDHMQSTFGRLVRVVGISRLATSVGGDVVDESGEAHRKYGAMNGALYLIRPDGYIGFKGGPLDQAALESDLAWRFTPVLPVDKSMSVPAVPSPSR
ncbi:MAG TPA: FAD-dependent monooxygenase [Gemmatimonadaceae bacterium]|jgi:2-polyprenyl-6-methoxyphenol hydroxylase-like FAD-dependent oxidoreductase